MNAGANGYDTWQNIKSVDVISKTELSRRSKKIIQIWLQKGCGKNTWFVRACFELKQNSSKDGLEKIKKILLQRKNSQPVGSSCGSVFVNPGISRLS